MEHFEGEKMPKVKAPMAMIRMVLHDHRTSNPQEDYLSNLGVVRLLSRLEEQVKPDTQISPETANQIAKSIMERAAAQETRTDFKYGTVPLSDAELKEIADLINTEITE